MLNWQGTALHACSCHTRRRVWSFLLSISMSRCSLIHLRNSECDMRSAASRSDSDLR
jgi:hypothetical protein